MEILRSNHTKRNYILCAGISAIMVLWNIVMIMTPALMSFPSGFPDPISYPRHVSYFEQVLESGVDKNIAILFSIILFIDFICIMRLGTKMVMLKSFPEEKHNTLAFLTILFAFLPTIIWMVLGFVLK